MKVVLLEPGLVQPWSQIAELVVAPFLHSSDVAVQPFVVWFLMHNDGYCRHCSIQLYLGI